MSTVGDREIRTQARVVTFFQKTLGYIYLRNWQERQGNSNIEKELLTDWLSSSGHDDAIITKVLYELQKSAAIGGSRKLYEANREVYGFLRYGVNVQPSTGEHRITVKLIDWEHPFNNDFGIAEQVLTNPAERLICSLVHKFGRSGEIADEDTDIDDYEDYLDDLQQHLPDGFQAKGEFFVFVDECHRTQSGKLHSAMKTLLPNAMLIGFTGTPLLKSDKQRSIETFGPYIHTYKYDEAVEDSVVLDLRYEARDIDQTLSSQSEIDQWFADRTSGLTNTARAQLRQRWSTLQNVLSSRERLGKIVADIVLDMENRDRLKSGRGNAMLVADSIFSACRFFQMFQETPLKGKCAIVTSYRPSADDVAREETGEGLTDRQTEYYTYREMLAEHFDEPENTAMHKADRFEQEVKKSFIEKPDEMKLLIVVDKLLTGFDAPPATYLYIDKNMQDHGLFQAICRVNRLDGEDKEFGYIVDYQDLFRSLEQAITDYTGEAFENFDAEDVQGLLKDRLEKGRERLEETREKVKALCEPVDPPRDSATHRSHIEIRGITVEVIRKDIKNLHIGVYPPNGRVRVAAPLAFDDTTVRMAVVSRLGWIQRQQAVFERQDRQSQREFVTGESHYFRGRRYRLDVVEQDCPAKIWLPNNTKIVLSVRPGSDRDTRESVVHHWYRQHLRSQLPPLLEKWEAKLDVSVNEVRIKKMKTLWGSCNIAAKRIWLNLELAKKPNSCLVYILVHEMVHLLERAHNERFHELMDGFLPQWRIYRDELNRAPLAHESWRY